MDEINLLGGAASLAEAESYILRNGLPFDPGTLLGTVMINKLGLDGKDAILALQACRDHQELVDRRALKTLQYIDGVLDEIADG